MSEVVIDGKVRNRFSYVARKQPCGCVMAAVLDRGNQFTADAVAEWIAKGAAVERVQAGAHWKRICAEPTFMACPHGQQPLFDPGER